MGWGQRKVSEVVELEAQLLECKERKKKREKQTLREVRSLSSRRNSLSFGCAIKCVRSANKKRGKEKREEKKINTLSFRRNSLRFGCAVKFVRSWGKRITNKGENSMLSSRRICKSLAARSSSNLTAPSCCRKKV